MVMRSNEWIEKEIHAGMDSTHTERERDRYTLPTRVAWNEHSALKTLVLAKNSHFPIRICLRQTIFLVECVCYLGRTAN